MSPATKKPTEEEESKNMWGHGKSKMGKAVKLVALVYLVVWVLIGIFVLAFIVKGTQKGMFNYVLFDKTPPAQAAPQGEVPTETDLPKIGTINIACAEAALTPESIQKLVGEYDYDITKLNADEKSSFEKCIVKPPVATPAS